MGDRVMQSAVTGHREVNHFNCLVMVYIGLTSPRAEVSLSPVIVSLFTGSRHISSSAVYTATNARRGKKLLNIESCFPLQNLSENFHILRKIQRVIIINVQGTYINFLLR